MGTQVDELAAELRSFSQRAAELTGSTAPAKPNHRVRFIWPPHPVSYEYNVHATDWSAQSSVEIEGETFTVEIARTSFGVFGRIRDLWLEARGTDDDLMTANLREAARPLLSRQRMIGECLGRDTRYTGHFSDLQPIDLLRLLYCPDRDVAHEAQLEIETRSRQLNWLPSLLTIIRDDVHPHRRSAQWCVLDLFETLPMFAPTESQEADAVGAIKDLIWTAEDDYARTIYKAGVVLGGHLPHRFGAVALLEALHAPSRIGRRSAIHGLFHVVEWMPDRMETVVRAMREVAQTDPDPVLRDYASGMADDIENQDGDHRVEPVFPGETS